MSFLKSLGNKIDLKIQWVMIFVLLSFSFLESGLTEYGFDIVTALLTKLLIGLAVIYLFSEKKLLGCYIVLLVGLFGNYIYDFVSYILSFQLSISDFIKQIDIYIIFGSLFSIYLVFMIITYLKKQEKIELKKHINLSVMFLALYLYMRYGYGYSFVALFLMLLFIIFDSKVGLYLIMLSYVIHIPFFLIDLMIDRIGFNLLSYWVYGWIGFVLMIWTIINLVKALNQENV